MRHRGRDNDTIYRIAVHTLELHSPHRDLGREADFTGAERQNTIAPIAQIDGSSNTSPPEAPTQLEDDNRRDSEVIGGEGVVAASSCCFSEIWQVFRHPKDRVRIEQEGHRTVPGCFALHALRPSPR